MFVPFNYFDSDVSRAVRQGVRIDRRPTDDDETEKNNKGKQKEIKKPGTLPGARGSLTLPEVEAKRQGSRIFRRTLYLASGGGAGNAVA